MKWRSYIIILIFATIAIAGCGSNSGNAGNQITLVSIAVTPKNATVAAGQTEQFTATGRYSDGTSKNLTTLATWSVSNSSVVSISTTGLATTKTQGSSSVTAGYAGTSGSTTFTVAAPALVSIAVTPPSASIAQGTTTKFKATGSFTDGSTQDVSGTVQWTSSATGVASVSSTIPTSGTAKGLAPGSVTITASSGTISGTASLTVTNATLSSIALTPALPSIPLGVIQHFTATGTFSDGTTQDISDIVSWSSSAPTVASITTNGTVTALNLGSTAIAAASGAINTSLTLTVNAADLASITINPGNATCAPMTSQQFSAIGTFNDGGTRNLTSQVSWSSSDTTIATIGASSGRAKALQTGQTTISATLGGVTSSTTFQVSNATISSISVTPSGHTIAPGTNQSFTATGTFSDSSSQNISLDVHWSSDNTAVATINGTGTATAVGGGTANISASFNGVTGSAPLKVSSATLVSIVVSPATAVLAPASTLNLEAEGTFSDGSSQNISNIVSWSSSDTSVATIGGSGTATGQSAGAVTITAQLGGISNTADLLVDASPLTAITITPGTVTVPNQFSVQLSATGTFEDGSEQGLTSSATWTGSPGSVVAVSDADGSKGLTTGASQGTGTVTALFAGVAGSAHVQVTNATLTSITISPSHPSISLGSSQQFTAVGSFSDGSTLNLINRVTWSSSNAGVAVIGSNGMAVSAGAGTTTITASAGGISSSTVLTVN
jgi:hypothetical protein